MINAARKAANACSKRQTNDQRQNPPIIDRIKIYEMHNRWSLIGAEIQEDLLVALTDS